MCMSFKDILIIVIVCLLCGFAIGIFFTKEFLIEKKPETIEISEIKKERLISEALMGYVSKIEYDSLLNIKRNIKDSINWVVKYKADPGIENDTIKSDSSFKYILEVPVKNKDDIPVAKKDTSITFKDTGQTLNSNIPFKFSAMLNHKSKYIYPPVHAFDDEYQLTNIKISLTYEEIKPTPWYFPFAWSFDDWKKALLAGGIVFVATR